MKVALELRGVFLSGGQGHYRSDGIRIIVDYLTPDSDLDLTEFGSAVSPIMALPNFALILEKLLLILKPPSFIVSRVCMECFAKF